MKNIFANKIQDDKNSLYEVNRLKLDNGLIHIMSKEIISIEYGCKGDLYLDTDKTTQIHNTLSGFEYTELVRPWIKNRHIDFPANKRFIVDEDKKVLYTCLSNYLLFDLILRKVDKECYLLYHLRDKTIYSVFDSSKKYIGDFTLLDTGFGIGKCQIDPKYTIEYNKDIESISGKIVQNAYDAAYYKVYGPKKELEAATIRLEEYNKRIKKKESDFIDKWGYLMGEKNDIQDTMLINQIEAEEKNKIEKEKTLPRITTIKLK